MLECLRLTVLRTLQEQFALARHALIEGQGGRSFQGVDDALRREQIFLLLRNALAGFVEESRGNVAGVDLQVANLAQWGLPGSKTARIVEGAFEQVALNDFVDDSRFGCERGGNRIARDDDAESGFNPDQAR